MSIFNNNKLDPFGTNSLFADINNTNQQINSMNLPSFAKEEEEKKRKKAEQMMKLQNLADTFNMVNAQKSGNAQGVALYSNRIKQRQLDEQARLKKAEQKARLAQYKENNPGMVGMLEALEAGIPYQLLMMQQNKNQDSNKLRFGNEDKLRDEHQKLSGTFIDVRDAYGRILSNAEEQTAASDLSLIFNYMKMLDPGSVVREGEFANAQNSAGVGDQVRAKYNSILSGERLAENTRKDFIQTAQYLYKTQLNTQKNLDKNYQDLATSYGLDPDKVVLDFNSPISKKEFKYNLSIMSNEKLASLDESQFTEEQIKEIEKEIKKRLP